MGCCVSTEENRAIQKTHQQQFPCISKSPPRPEEESVKEVLSETPQPWPKPKPNPKPRPNDDPDPETEDLLELLKPTKPNLFPKEKQLPIDPLKSPDPGSGRVCTTPEEISDVSEMCSLSETISTTTLREEDEVLQRVYRSQGQNGHFPTNKNRSFSAGRSPARRSEPSPQRARNPGPGPVKRADGPRRSRSPAARSNVGRSPSGRRAGPSPGRVRMVQERENGGVKRVEEVNERRKEKEKEKENENENENEWEGPNESLENPLVSLECFIFL